MLANCYRVRPHQKRVPYSPMGKFSHYFPIMGMRFQTNRKKQARTEKPLKVFIFRGFCGLLRTFTNRSEIGKWRLHRESNPDLSLRRGLFYPLNYRGARGRGAWCKPGEGRAIVTESSQAEQPASASRRRSVAVSLPAFRLFRVPVVAHGSGSAREQGTTGRLLEKTPAGTTQGGLLLVYSPELVPFSQKADALCLICRTAWMF